MKFLAALVMSALLSACAFVQVPLNPPVQEIREQVVGGSGGAKIVVVDISGMLTLGQIGLDRFAKEPPQIPRLREELEKAGGDEKVVGLVVRIDSPGGSVTASDILFHELDRFKREKRVPVVACVMDKALSGGYYAALAADKVVAHPTSVLGGVGVISYRLNLAPMLQKWGVETEVVKSAPLKDFWSPLRASTAQEMTVMQGITDSLRERFLGLVRERRPLSPQALEEVATARIFGAAEGEKLGLVDRLGYLEDAVAWTRELAGVAEARTVIYRRPGAFAGNIFAADLPLVREMSMVEQGASELLSPSFRYQLLQ